jgi:hypothetical protein
MASMPMPNFGFDVRNENVSAVFTYCTILQNHAHPKRKLKNVASFFILLHFLPILPFSLNSSAKENTFSFKRKKNWVLEEFLKFQQAIFKRRKTNFRDNVFNFNSMWKLFSL